jgi:hypothetical protein
MPDRALVDELIERFDARQDCRPGTVRLVRELLAEPTAPATHHVLGFCHIAVGEQQDRTLRLHLWPNPPLPLAHPPWPIHTHGWTVDSFVAVGAIENVLYDVDPDADGESELYRVEYRATDSARVSTGERVSCEVRHREAHVAGSYYAIQRNDFHASRVLSDFAATLVVTGPRDGSARVVGYFGVEKVFSYPRKKVKRSEAVELLRTLDRKLTGEAV